MSFHLTLQPVYAHSNQYHTETIFQSVDYAFYPVLPFYHQNNGHELSSKYFYKSKNKAVINRTFDEKGFFKLPRK